MHLSISIGLLCSKQFKLGLGNTGDDITTDWPMKWTWAFGGSSPPSLSLELMCCPPFPQLEPFSRMQPWKSKVVLRPYGQCTWLNSVKPLYKRYDSGGQVWRSTCLAAAQHKPHVKLPCLLHLPPTNLEWPAFFFSLSFPCVYGVQFVKQKAILRKDHVPFITDAAKGLERRPKLLGAKYTV